MEVTAYLCNMFAARASAPGLRLLTILHSYMRKTYRTSSLLHVREVLHNTAGLLSVLSCSSALAILSPHLQVVN